MPDVNVTFGGDGTPVAKAWQVSAEGVAQFIDEVKKIAGASNAADNAQRELGATANRWIKQMESPLDAHLKRLAELQTILQAGKITQDQYTKGIQLSVAQMRQAEEAADTLGQTAKRVLQEQVTPQDQYNERLAKANELLAAGKINEAQYATEVEAAKKALDDKDVALQKTLNAATRIKAAAVTPEQAHAKAIGEAKEALDKKLITQKEFDSELDRQNKLLAKAKEGTEDLGGASSSVTSQFASELTGLGSLMGAVGATTALLNSELTEFRESQKTSAEKQLDTAASQRAAVFNLGDDPTMSPEQLHEEAMRISLKNKVPVKQVYDVFSNALSSKSALTAGDAISAADIGTEAMPHEGATEIAGSVLDMKNRYGGTHAQMMGINFGTQQASRVKDAASFTKNVVPSIVNLGGFGNTAQESSTLVAALSTSMTDLEGRSSGTASEQLAEQLKKALPKYKSTTEALTFLQSKAGEKDRDKLFGNAKKGIKAKFSFEMGAWNSMRELVSDEDNATKRAYAAAAAAIPSMDKAAEYYQDALARVERQPLQKQSAYDRSVKVAAEHASLNNLQGGQAAISREGLDNALKQSGEGFFSRFITARKMDYAEFTGSETPAEFSARTLQQKADSLRKGKNYEGNLIGPTDAELKTADSLSEVGTQWNQMNAAPQPSAPLTSADAKELTEAIKQQTKATEKQTAKPPVVLKKQNNLPTKTPTSQQLVKP